MSNCRNRIIIASGALLLAFSVGARAQNNSPQPERKDQLALVDPSLQTEQKSPATQPAQSPQDPPQPAKPIQDDKNKPSTPNQNGTSNDRLFYALPNFLTLENVGKVPPLTAGQKFKAVARGSFDPVQFAWVGFLSGISQAENSEPGYGQGASGYGKRYGAAFGDNTTENFFVGAILPSLLHQDPRFFQSSKGGFAHRAAYAVSRIFITRGDSGHGQFNFSEVFGAAMAAGISTYSYHPRQDKTLVNTASVWGTEMGWDAVTFVVKEFWPDIRRKMHKPKPQPVT
jgi:hypothetical protein